MIITRNDIDLILRGMYLITQDVKDIKKGILVTNKLVEEYMKTQEAQQEIILATLRAIEENK